MFDQLGNLSVGNHKLPLYSMYLRTEILHHSRPPAIRDSFLYLRVSRENLRKKFAPSELALYKIPPEHLKEALLFTRCEQFQSLLEK